MQGIGIALVSTATVAAPITLYGNTLFISQLRELTIDKLLEMRLAPQLAQELRRKALDADMYDVFKWHISLDPVEGRPDLLIIHSRRDYTIPNRTYRPRKVVISHSEETIAPLLQNFTPGYKAVTFALNSLEDSKEPKPVNFDPDPLESGSSKFLNRPIKIRREKWAVMLEYQLELPLRSSFHASVASETCVHSDGTVPFICDRPSTSLEMTVIHRRDTAIGVLPLNNPDCETVKPWITRSHERAGMIEENWVFSRGFFPGNGIQLYWAPQHSESSSNRAEARIATNHERDPGSHLPGRGDRAGTKLTGARMRAKPGGSGVQLACGNEFAGVRGGGDCLAGHLGVEELLIAPHGVDADLPLGTAGLGQSAKRCSGPSRGSASAVCLLLVTAAGSAIRRPGRAGALDG